MSFRIYALVGLSGLAACSNTTTEPAREPSSAQLDQQEEAGMRPASRDTGHVATTEPGDRTGASDVRAPYVADTSTARSGELRAEGPATAAPVEPPRANQDPTTGARTDGSTTATQPDNTKKNERDRAPSALTPVDQGNNETDLKITQQIRQAVMADGSLSFTAKNVKIITTGGQVTLRGPVKTTAERDAIDAAARKVAGNRVDNQIEVKK